MIRKQAQCDGSPLMKSSNVQRARQQATGKSQPEKTSQKAIGETGCNEPTAANEAPARLAAKNQRINPLAKKPNA